MTSWHEYALTVIAQVTAISLMALTLIACCPRSAATRHAVGVFGLTFILSSPFIALILPQAQWWWPATSSTPSLDSMHAYPDEAARLEEFEQPKVETQIVADNVIKEAPGSSPLQSVSETAKSDAPGLPSKVSLPINALEEMKSAQPRWSWLGDLALFVWLFGAVVSATVWLRQQHRLRWLTRSLKLVQDLGAIQARDSSSLNGDIQAVAQEVRIALGLRELSPIAVSDTVPMPLVLGIWRPIIVIPSTLLQPGDGETRLRDVLIHEVAHVARRDAWINVAQRVASVLWWWHPAVFGLNRAIARSREEVCDNFVLKHSDAPGYAQTLLELAEKCSPMGRALPSLGLLGNRWTLEARIRGLLKPGREMMTRTNRRIVVMIAVVLGGISLVVGGVRAVSDDQGSAKEERELQARPGTNKPEADAKSVAALRKVVVRGQCVNEKSESLTDVRVLILRRSADFRSQVIAGATKTDANGRFELHDVETAGPEPGDLIAVAALKEHVTAVVNLANPVAGEIQKEIKLSSNPGTLFGTVCDAQAKPIQGVTVYLPCTLDEPLPGIRSSITDEKGRFAITDLQRWTPESTRTFDPKTKTGTMVASCNFLLKHPDYPVSTAQHSAVPQEVHVTLYPPAIVEGQVIDAVTNQPAANVTVSAQAIARSGWFQTRTDAQGRYRLLMTRDHYNIWAAAEDRIAVAVKALQAESGKTVSKADIRLVSGGFVVGTVFGEDGKPLAPTKESPAFVAHYGPARPRTGAAVTSTRVQADGTYRLRVAPGENYVYSMSEGITSGSIAVEDGKETPFDIHLGKKPGHLPETADERLFRKLRRAAEAEDAALAEKDSQSKSSRPAGAKPVVSKVAVRQRPATEIGKLLDELAEQNESNDRFNDSWCRTLKAIVDLGPTAVPELIAELESTNDNMMLRCLGFTLRAINDKRAVPALIRAIPKTLLPAGSDMGCRAEDKAIAEFMQRHDLDERHEAMKYAFCRPVREIFGALNKLTGKSFDEEQLYHVFAEGEGGGNQRRKQELFDRTASKWAGWWEKHWSEYLQDAAYSRVDLPKLQAATSRDSQQHFKTGGGHSNWLLESFANPKSNRVFYDLDTGRTTGLPEKWRLAKNLDLLGEEIVAWATREGYDLMGTDYVSPTDRKRYFALRPISLQTWELGKKRWKMMSQDTTLEALQSEGTPTAGLLLHFDSQKEVIDPKETATFLFKTREGTPGLLFVGVEVQDDSQKPGGFSEGDNELNPVGFSKGRRFGWTSLVEIPAK